ncbi:hypothetical protein FRC03_009360 [Tulasnella sp. 419]|nr:hypothetical protein FRC03_009360 [Tulasnella sp. 419]
MAKSTNQKSSKKATSKQQSSDSENEALVDTGEAEDEVQEEYEIEAVLRAKKGRIFPGEMAYFVKWKGYDSDENSWVAERDFNAHDLLDEFWKRNEIKQRKERQSANGRKSSIATKKSSRAETVSDREMEEVPKKRGRASKASTRKTPDSDEENDKKSKGAFDDMDQDEDENKPPKKKAKTGGAKSSKSRAKVEEDDVEDEKTPSEGEGHAAISEFPEWRNKASWEDYIKIIETVEKTSDPATGEPKLLIYFRTHDDRRGVQDSKILRAKAPQTIIDFYEDHLRWQAAQEEAASEGAEKE